MDEKIINTTFSRLYFFLTRAKFNTNNGLFKENLVKYKGKKTSREYTFILFLILTTKYQELNKCTFFAFLNYRPVRTQPFHNK